MATFQQGEHVIYCVEKHTARPGRRAKYVRPEPRGEYYDYCVDKLWAVAEVYQDGAVRLVTRRGKSHVVRSDDPKLRRPNILERLVYRNRFPVVRCTEVEGQISTSCKRPRMQ